MTRSLRLVVLAGLMAVGSDGAGAVTPVDAGWDEIARSSNGDCEMVVTGNGRFYRIAVSGLGAGEGARYRLSNGDMKPIDWQVRADSSGRFARYYVPFRALRQGGEVDVTLAGSSCSVGASFAWQRAGIVVQ